MKTKIPTLAALSALALSAAVRPAHADDSAGYRLTQTYRIGGAGSWDYLIVDQEHKLLFVPRSTHVLVIDAKTGATVADIPGLKHAHGVALVPSAGRGFISDGDAGAVLIFDLKTYAVLGTVKAEDDADGIIYDPASNKVFVDSGDGGVVIPISPDVDPASGKADKAIELGGKPEYLAADGNGRVFINITDKSVVAVLDTKTMSIVDRWSTAPGGEPVALAIDRENHRLVLGCRKPQKLVVMSTDDGKIIGSVPIGAGADAAQVSGDEAFAACRDGSLTVVKETSPGKFEVAQTLKTNIWAGTMGLDASTHTLYFPTANFAAGADWSKRPAPLPNTFKILVVSRAGE